MFIASIISTLSKVTEEKKSRYEDILRVLMGSKAYLLFEFQNIIVDTLKFIQISFLSSEENQNTFNLFKEQMDKLGGPVEQAYLAQFNQKIVNI